MNPMITVWLLFAGLLLSFALILLLFVELCFDIVIDDKIYMGIVTIVFALMVCAFGSLVFFMVKNAHMEVVK